MWCNQPAVHESHLRGPARFSLALRSVTSRLSLHTLPALLLSLVCSFCALAFAFFFLCLLRPCPFFCFPLPLAFPASPALSFPSFHFRILSLRFFEREGSEATAVADSAAAAIFAAAGVVATAGAGVAGADDALSIAVATVVVVLSVAVAAVAVVAVVAAAGTVGASGNADAGACGCGCGRICGLRIDGWARCSICFCIGSCGCTAPLGGCCGLPLTAGLPTLAFFLKFCSKIHATARLAAGGRFSWMAANHLSLRFTAYLRARETRFSRSAAAFSLHSLSCWSFPISLHSRSCRSFDSNNPHSVCLSNTSHSDKLLAGSI